MKTLEIPSANTFSSRVPVSTIPERPHDSKLFILTDKSRKRKRAAAAAAEVVDDYEDSMEGLPDVDEGGEYYYSSP